MLVTEAMRRLGHHKKFEQAALHVVLERGHRHAGDAERIFEEMRRAYATDGLQLLKTFTPATKEAASRYPACPSDRRSLTASPSSGRVMSSM